MMDIIEFMIPYFALIGVVVTVIVVLVYVNSLYYEWRENIISASVRAMKRQQKKRG